MSRVPGMIRVQRTVWPVAHFEGRYTKARHRMSVPEANTGSQQNGLFGGQLLDDFEKVSVRKVGRRHLSVCCMHEIDAESGLRFSKTNVGTWFSDRCVLYQGCVEERTT